MGLRDFYLNSSGCQWEVGGGVKGRQKFSRQPVLRGPTQLMLSFGQHSKTVRLLPQVATPCLVKTFESRRLHVLRSHLSCYMKER
ncbi:hypothetical protein PoB_000647400 [Plakobranchus ocellatus]|uniref:Uncharacterized protein n=1 Tax=Plakobranchus ocellatus TaxID=259542 RepID=A0AAV3YCL0_9GAST|nr:hypothetical protein PoB_000647400 [Plakobranchus ocellatus]